MSFLEHYQATAAGEQLLHDPEASGLLTVVDAFYDTTDRPPEAVVFEAVHDLGGNYIGAGRFSHVMRLGGFAIKVSTLTSTQSSEKPKVAPFAEDAIRQLHFLDSLRTHLDTIPESGVTTPQQYFAVRGEHGGNLSVQQFMEGWIPMLRWADRALRFKNEEEAWAGSLAISDAIKARIEEAVAGTDLRAGLNDLHLDGELLHPTNILVPGRGAYDPAIMPICIIDQPKTFSLPGSSQ